MKIGVDIIEIQRFENMAKDINKLQTLFTNKEIAYFDKYTNKLEHIAGLFAAKEAVVKAFKTGFNAKIVPLDVEILHEVSGAPIVNLKAGAKEYYEQHFVDIDISISHNKTQAMATCIVQEK